MPALTLWQPWAAAVPEQLKRFETRSWSTKHRGLLAIHAGGRCSREDVDRLDAWGIDEVTTLGSMIAIVRVRDVVEITAAIRDCTPPSEVRWGDWTPGRFAWALDVVADLRGKPHANWRVARGRQRLFRWQVPPALDSILLDKLRAGVILRDEWKPTWRDA